MKLRKLILAALVAAPLAVFAAPPSAADVLSSAEAKAKNSHRNVMLIYHASWCGWCHKLDDALQSPEISGLISKAYVVVHVDVLESQNKKNEENAGGLEQMNAYGADDKSGIPFFVFLTPEGTVLGTSKKPGSGNIGYPGEPDEITYFMELVTKSTPMLSDGQRSKIEGYFKLAATKLPHASGH